MNIRDELKALPAYHFSAKESQIKLDQNESPFDLPLELRSSINEKLSNVALNRYPELNAHGLKQRLAAQLGVSPDGIVFSGGSNVLIQALVIAAGLGKSVLSVAPSFSVYNLQAKLLGSELVEVPLGADFALPVDDLVSVLREKSGVFFLANPAAPTGNCFSADDVLRLAEASKDDWLFVIDEAYHQFSKTDFSFLIERFDHVVCLRTFSKAYGLGGVRLGYGLMQSALAENIQKVILPFSISVLQLALAETVLEHKTYVDGHIELLLGERERVFAELSGLSQLRVFPSETNFILFEVRDAEKVYTALLDHGVLIRRQDHLPQLEGCLRVAIGTKEENDMFLLALKESLKKEAVYV